jgi:hypothetical protein
MTMTTLEIVLIVIAIALGALILGTTLWMRSSRERRMRLQERFGDEYRHAVEEAGSERRADRLLQKRMARVDRFDLRRLDADERRAFQDRWFTVQQRFLDTPEGALRQAHELVLEVMTALGYPEASVEQRMKDLSVHHPELIDHYREAAATAKSWRASRASTEELRRATVHYRVLVEELLEEAPLRPRREAAEEARVLRP